MESNYQHPTVVIEQEKEIVSIEQSTVEINQRMFLYLF